MSDSFVVEGVIVTVEEMPLSPAEGLLLEDIDSSLLNFINNRVKQFATRVTGLFRDEPDPSGPNPAIPSERPTMKKFRVKLQYPRSRKDAKYGHYRPDVLYVYADSSPEAKRKAEEYVRTKLEPVENDETRRYIRHNYLQDVKRKFMDLKSERVSGWKGFTDMLSHVANKRGEMTPLYYFDEGDFETLLKQSKKKSFDKDLKKLGKKEQSLLKRFYFHMAQSPWLDNIARAMLDDDLAAKMRRLGKKASWDVEDELPDSSATPDWDYWSVFEPDDEEEAKLLQNADTVKDVFEIGRRFGISPTDLRAVKERLFVGVDEQERSLQKLWSWLNRRIRLSPKNRIFWDSDYANPKLVKYGIRWDELVDELLNATEDWTEYMPIRWLPGENTSEASSWLWDFYRDGKPKREPRAKQWKAALEYLLDYRREAVGKKELKDYVPF